MNNPDPARITGPMWRLWEEHPIPALLSGIYADKKGYHNTVEANLKKWPGNYSTRFPLDLVKFNRDKARALDETMTEVNMIKWTSRMKKSAEDPDDKRLAAVREFYGTLDGKNVFGLIKDGIDKPWRHATADDTHLWHGHKGIFTAFVNDWKMLSPIISVESGESLDDWKAPTDMFINKGDTGPEVSYWQSLHNAIRNTVTPPAPEVKVDGIYGEALAKAFTDMVHKQGGQAAYNGQSTPYWMLLRYQTALIDANTSEVTPPLALDEGQLKVLVTEWLAEHLPKDLVISGKLEGKVEL
jgi:hypothetical protein